MKNLITYEQFVLNESTINEGAVKQFEVAIKNLISNIRSGYGWIDPEYVYDTVVTDSGFDEFEWKTIKDEVYKRLIDQNLLYYANDADPETKGQKVSKVEQIKESINEGVKVKAICTHCGKTQIAEEKDYSLNYVKCKFCKKEGNLESINNESVDVNEASDEFVPATLTEDFEDLAKGSTVKIKAIDYTSGGDKETVESIRPDGNKMDIKKSVLTVKI
jgi:hypothetical protein